MCRGNRRDDIFLDDEDRKRFLETLSEARERTGWRIHAYVLMGNHYHLLLETPEANLVAGMRWFQGTYTARFNFRHGLGGHLFQGRYKALPVAPDEEGYFLQVSSYIHLNPVRARLVRPGVKPLASFAWSSYPEYLKPVRKRSGLVEVERVLGELGLEDSPSGRRRYAAHMEGLGADAVKRKGRREMEGEWKEIRRGWYLGSEVFRERMQKLVAGAVSGKRRRSFSGAGIQAHDEASAGRLLKAGLKAMELEPEELEGMRKLEIRKQVLAWWVRKQTTVSNRWVSEHLRMGDAGNISKVVRAVENGKDRHVRGLKRRVMKSAEIPKSGD